MSTRGPFGWAFCLLLLGGTRLGAQTNGPQKRALIIAIGEYSAESGYPRLHTTGDVDLVRAALLAQGFDSTAIKVLRDQAATREGILAALQQLTESAGTGDAIVVHYSGHGHRITDDNGDELDGLDEILVPYGAPAAIRRGGYHGERHIRDDELGVILTRLRRRVGRTGSVSVFLDACYSGSGTRAADDPAVRGMAERIITDGGTRQPRVGSDEGSGFLAEAPSTRDAGSAGNSGGLGALVVISAARHDQVARETRDASSNPVGSLSLGLSRALARVKPATSYRVLFDRISSAMASMDLGDQQPQLEGTADAVLFSGQVAARQPFVRVARINSDSELEVAAGTVLGFLPGTGVAFYPRGTLSPGTGPVLASGIVLRASASSAIVNVAPAGVAGLAESWAFVTEYAFGDLRLRLGLDGRLRSTTRAAVHRALDKLEIITWNDSLPDIRIVPAAAGGGERILAMRAGARTAQTTPLDRSAPTFEADLRAAILTMARASYIRRLDLESPELSVRMEMIPTEPRIDWSGSQPSCSGAAPVPRKEVAPSSEGNVLWPRDEYTLRLTNDGQDPAYVAVLDIQPNDRVSQLFPLPEAEGSDNLLPPGRSYLIQDACFFAEEPFGVETLKLFATRERVDFSTLLSGTGASRGDLDPLERLFAGAWAGTGGALRGPPDAASTYGITVNIVRPTARRSRRQP